MFIFTAKFSKRKAIIAVLILAVVLIAIIVLAGRAGRSNAKETAAPLSAVVRDNDQRVGYLASLGWEVQKEPLEHQDVVIPRDFTAVYTKYNDLQKTQGFDLSKYGGLEATRYTYKVLNYPDVKGSVVADIIIYRNRIIAGDVQSNALDGFMVGLKYPTPAMKPSPSASAAPSVMPSSNASAAPSASAAPKATAAPKASSAPKATAAPSPAASAKPSPKA